MSVEVYDHSYQAFHLINTPRDTHDRWDSSIIGFVAIPSDVNKDSLMNELDALWNGWYHEYSIVNNQTGDTVDSEFVSSYSELSNEFKNKIHELELEDDFKSYIYESYGKKVKKKLFKNRTKRYL